MSEHTTKNSARAAAGKTRLTRSSLEKPDTLVILPSGETITLRRREQDQMPMFRKLNPKRYDTRSGRLHGSKLQQQDGKSTFRQGPRVPFARFILTALLMQQAVTLLRGWWGRWRASRKPGQLTAGGQEEGDEYEEVEDITPAATQAESRLREALLPAMMRSALPKPSGRRTTAAQLAAMHKAQKRHLPSAKQMMGPGQNVKRKQPGLLGRLDKAMHKQARELLLAQEQAAQLQLEAARRMLALQAAPSTQQQQQAAAASAANGGGSQAAVKPAPVVLQPADNPVRKR